ncbi:MAG TPA: hypothetical protein VFC19_34450 [Candidatus Limnocylindrales bacterium]|nr:hypothetical protein [Candidatus Limnocylindrales bacterium]
MRVAEAEPAPDVDRDRWRLKRQTVRASLDQTASGLPLSKRDSIIQRCTTGDDRTVGFDLRPGVQQRVEGVDVVT